MRSPVQIRAPRYFPASAYPIVSVRGVSSEAGEEPYLPRAHRAISNLKAWLHGTHRHASRAHLQPYLDEFVFRHSRRRNPHAAFQTLLGLSTRHQPASYRQIIDAAA